jgi:uncharacterized protein (TIGR03086 family)
MSNGSQRYRQVARGFDAAVTATPSERWAAPSPCEGWTARDVVGHVVGNHRWLVTKARGGEAKPLGEDENPADAWREAYEAVLELTEDPAAMNMGIEGPAGEMPLEEMIGRFVSMDVLVHTWDLARAVGGDEQLDHHSVVQSYESMKPLDDQIRLPGVFGPKLAAPAGADTQTEFLYFLGRRA